MLASGGPEIRGYHDLTRIGRGGFSVVYRAQQVTLDRPVAIKVLLADLDEDDQVRRFTNECRILGRLGIHRHVVDVHEAGVTDEGRPFIVMKFYGRGSLAERIRSTGPLPVAETIAVGSKMASALQAAHEVGVIHRDVKPDNILVDDDGEPILTDFGVAAVADVSGQYTSSVAFSRAHVAPEVLARNAFGVASDVYGLGSTLFTLLTGRAAFAADTEALQIVAILNDRVPALDGPGIPAGLSAVIARAMAKKPEERYATAELLGQALLEIDPSRADLAAIAAHAANAEDAHPDDVDEATRLGVLAMPTADALAEEMGDDSDATRRRDPQAASMSQAPAVPAAPVATRVEQTTEDRRPRRRAILLATVIATVVAVIAAAALAVTLGRSRDGVTTTAPAPAPDAGATENPVAVAPEPVSASASTEASAAADLAFSPAWTTTLAGDASPLPYLSPDGRYLFANQGIPNGNGFNVYLADVASGEVLWKEEGIATDWFGGRPILLDDASDVAGALDIEPDASGRGQLAWFVAGGQFCASYPNESSPPTDTLIACSRREVTAVAEDGAVRWSRSYAALGAGSSSSVVTVNGGRALAVITDARSVSIFDAASGKLTAQLSLQVPLGESSGIEGTPEGLLQVDEDTGYFAYYSGATWERAWQSRDYTWLSHDSNFAVLAASGSDAPGKAELREITTGRIVWQGEKAGYDKIQDMGSLVVLQNDTTSCIAIDVQTGVGESWTNCWTPLGTWEGHAVVVSPSGAIQVRDEASGGVLGSGSFTERLLFESLGSSGTVVGSAYDSPTLQAIRISSAP